MATDARCNGCGKTEEIHEKSTVFVDANLKKRQLPKGWAVLELTREVGMLPECKAFDLCEECSEKVDVLLKVVSTNAPERELGAPGETLALPAKKREPRKPPAKKRKARR